MKEVEQDRGCDGRKECVVNEERKEGRESFCEEGRKARKVGGSRELRKGENGWIQGGRKEGANEVGNEGKMGGAGG